ncbi:hypothetical protein [Peribacillus simplex]|uniref:hypothetical protein n=1 Tax=Peribacillus simplex TaxID=1478 RepID=UPI0024C0F7E2|nr:hypothetical protein [Peribacillus simplex]WHY99566.1 hypothetical protein QNH37_10650 [Peribacillus simplex]
MEREINSFEVAVGGAAVSTFKIGKEIRGEVIEDIIVHDGVVKLYNRKDELITEIIDPTLWVKYVYVGGGGVLKGEKIQTSWVFFKKGPVKDLYLLNV